MTASETFFNLPPDKRQRVVAEAESEFARQGYEGASMNRLAARLGIAKGSLFKYFGSKEGCLAAVFDHGVSLFGKRMREARDLVSAEAAGAPDEELFATVERLLAAAMAFVDEHPNIYRIYLKMQVNEDFPLRGVILPRIRSNVARLLAPLVARARQRGELRPDVQDQAVVYALEALCERLLLDHSQGRLQQEQGVGAILDLLRHGCSREDKA